MNGPYSIHDMIWKIHKEVMQTQCNNNTTAYYTNNNIIICNVTVKNQNI